MPYPEEFAADHAAITLDQALPEGTIGLHIDVTAVPATIPIVGRSGAAVSLPFGTAGVYRIMGVYRQVNTPTAGTATIHAILGKRDKAAF